MNEFDFSQISISRVGNPRSSNYDLRWDKETNDFYISSSGYNKLGLDTRALLDGKSPGGKVFLISTLRTDQNGIFATGKNSKKFKRDALAQNLAVSGRGESALFVLEKRGEYNEDWYFEVVPAPQQPEMQPQTHVESDQSY